MKKLPLEVLTVLTLCEKCDYKIDCEKYDIKKQKRRCPIEANIYLSKYNEMIKYGVDPEKYADDLYNFCVLSVKLWRRRRFEADNEVPSTDALKISSEANKIQNTILKLKKQMGVDRAHDLKNVKSLPGVKENQNISQVFTQIQNIKVGKIEITDKEKLTELNDNIKNRIKEITIDPYKSEKKLSFDDLGFDEFGFNIEPKTTEEVALIEPINDIEKMPLVNPDTDNERYIPKRKEVK